LLEQSPATPQHLKQILCELLQDEMQRERMQGALAQWHNPQAAERIAGAMLEALAREGNSNAKASAKPGGVSSSEPGTLARGSAFISRA